MGTINLTSANTPGIRSGGEIPYARGVAIITAVVIVLAIAYGAIYFYKSGLDGKISAADAEYKVELSKLTGDENKNVVDFQNRIVIAKGLLKERTMSVEGISEMEEDILPGVVIESYAYDKTKNEIVLGCLADDFASVAKQVMIFKQAGFFAEISPGDISMREKGKFGFAANLKIKN